ncbi:PD-(D/E)XK nuclease family protein [Atopobiaceae bacterium 24-176]
MPVEEALRLSAGADRSWMPPEAVTSFWMREPLGPGPKEAWCLDRKWRGDRMAGPQDILDSLAASARACKRPDLSRALAALGQGRAVRAVRSLGEGPAACDPDVVWALSCVEEALLAIGEERKSRGLPATDELRAALAERLPPLVPLPPPQISTKLPIDAPEASDETCSPWDVGAFRPFLVCRVDERAHGLPRLSASQIESYGECPGKWLTLRRLGLGGVDAAFDGASVGSFVHRVLEGIHRRLYEEACTSAAIDPDERPLAPVAGSAVCKEALGRALDLLKEEIESDLSNQLLSYRRAGQQSVVPHTPEELGRLGAAARELDGFVRWEAEHEDGLQPRWFEAAFGRTSPRVLGGASFVGTVDRIDVAPSGVARIVDYKHRSAAEEYAAGAPATVAPRHLQTYLYALMVDAVDARLRPGAAVYEGTMAPWEPAGAGTREGLGSLEQQPFVNVMQQDAFSSVLSSAACEVSRLVGRLLGGDVAPDPVDACACSFCPAFGCPRRLAPDGAPVDDHAFSPSFQVAAAAAFLTQPADTASGLFPLLVGPLFALDAGDLVLLATGRDPQTGRLTHRRLDRGVLAGDQGLVAPPSQRLAFAVSVLGKAVAAAAVAPLDEAVRSLVEESGWPARLSAAASPEASLELAQLTAALSRLSCSVAQRRRLL